jgi:hypothetical protein
MNATTATAFITTNKGADIEIVLVDGDSVYGTALSVNSKGVNVKDDAGKTRSVSLTRIDELVLVEDDTFGADDDADDLAAAGLIDGELDTEVDEDEESFMDESAEDADAALTEVLDTLSEGATTAEMAAALSDHLNIALTPKELRVHLRALGLGVGKGRTYALSAGEFRAVRDLILAAA